MKNAVLLCLLACLLIACSAEEPERPSETDEARFNDIDSMLDKEHDAEALQDPDD